MGRRAGADASCRRCRAGRRCGAGRYSRRGERSIAHRFVTPRSRIALDVGPARTIGVFGDYDGLTLQFDRPLGGATILARDLASDASVDITARVIVDGTRLTFPGELLAEVGLAAATRGDASEPGLVIWIRPRAAGRDFTGTAGVAWSTHSITVALPAAP